MRSALDVRPKHQTLPGDMYRRLSSRARAPRCLVGKYITERLTLDQTGFDEGELARVRAAHPDEPGVINTQTGRMLGIVLTRAFGDGLWKWPIDVVKECHEKFFYAGHDLATRLPHVYLQSLLSLRLKFEGRESL